MDNGGDASVGTTAAGNAGIVTYARQHPDQWRMNNGVWEHNQGGTWTPSFKADGTPVANPAQPGGTFGNWFDRLTSGRGDIMGNDTEKEIARKKSESAAAAAGAQHDDITARMNAFIQAMGIPPDMSNPVYAGLINAGTAAAGRMQGNAGLSGRSGLAGTQAASVVQANTQPYLASREAAGADMLKAVSGRDVSLGQLDMAQQQVNNGLAESQSNANKNTWSSLAGLAGGVVGGPGGAMLASGVAGSLAGGGGSGPSYNAPAWKPGRTGGTGF
jgi:hypothetical protein